MAPPENRCYHLPADAVALLAARSVGKLKPVLTPEDAALPFTVFDTFDQPLCRSGRLLVEVGASWELLTRDGPVLRQPSERTGTFVAGLREGPVKRALADLSPLRSLLPLGSGTMRKGQLAVLDDNHKTHCRAHLRILSDAETGKGGVAIVTLQGLRGYDASLAALRRHVEACGGTALAQGGLCAALFPGRAVYTARPDIVITPDDTAFAAATGIIARYIPVARANEAGIIADHDTEFLHDYRIALRKIRSVLSLFKGVYADDQTDDLKARFSDLMASTGRLRDLDVYLLDRQRLFDLLPPALHGGLNSLFLLFTDEREAERDRLARHLQSEGYDREVAALARLFGKRKKLHPGPRATLGAHDYACALIRDRYRKIRKSAAKIGPDTEDEEVHRLRIHCKKLRYLMEFFGPLFPGPAFKSLLKPLKKLQDNLGLFNDYAVQQLSLQAFISQRESGPDSVSLEVAQSVGALIAVLHRRQIEERAKVVESFARFNSPATQQTFHDLFRAGGNQT